MIGVDFDLVAGLHHHLIDFGEGIRMEFSFVVRCPSGQCKVVRRHIGHRQVQYFPQGNLGSGEFEHERTLHVPGRGDAVGKIADDDGIAVVKLKQLQFPFGKKAVQIDSSDHLIVTDNGNFPKTSVFQIDSPRLVDELQNGIRRHTLV